MLTSLIFKTSFAGTEKDVDEDWWLMCWDKIEEWNEQAIENWFNTCEVALQVCQCGCGRALWPCAIGVQRESNLLYYFDEECLKRRLSPSVIVHLIPLEDVRSIHEKLISVLTAGIL